MLNFFFTTTYHYHYNIIYSYIYIYLLACTSQPPRSTQSVYFYSQHPPKSGLDSQGPDASSGGRHSEADDLRLRGRPVEAEEGHPGGPWSRELCGGGSDRAR